MISWPMWWLGCLFLGLVWGGIGRSVLPERRNDLWFWGLTGPLCVGVVILGVCLQHAGVVG